MADKDKEDSHSAGVTGIRHENVSQYEIDSDERTLNALMIVSDELVLTVVIAYIPARQQFEQQISAVHSLPNSLLF